MATYTLKSAVASVSTSNNTQTANLFTATAQTVIKSLFCNFNSTPTYAVVTIQKSGGSLCAFYRFSVYTGNVETVGTNGLFLETGDTLGISCTSNSTIMTGIASYTVIT